MDTSGITVCNLDHLIVQTGPVNENNTLNQVHRDFLEKQIK